MPYSIAAIIPMRHSSERVPGKNYRDFAGKPLFHRIVDTLLDCPSITQVIIDTDSPAIIQQAKNHYPTVTVLERPDHLRDGAIPMNNVLLNTCNQIEADFYLQTHSTNPLLSAATVEKGLKQFLAQYPIYDTLFGVTRMQVRFWDQLARAINHNPNILLRTQIYHLCIWKTPACIYLRRKLLLRKESDW